MVNEMQGTKILVVDDDPELLQLVELVFADTDAQVFTAIDGRQGMREFHRRQPDVVLLDLMMPEPDGWQVCQRIRQVSDVPLIMLTALGETDDVIRGFNLGADDYVTKPFSFDVLVARTRAALRRAALSPAKADTLVYSDDYLVVDLERRRVLLRGEPVKLSPTEYRLLAFLLRNIGHACSFRQILEAVWGQDHRASLENLYHYISRLRRKLEIDPQDPKYVLTEGRVGYRFQPRTPA